MKSRKPLNDQCVKIIVIIQVRSRVSENWSPKNWPLFQILVLVLSKWILERMFKGAILMFQNCENNGLNVRTGVTNCHPSISCRMGMLEIIREQSFLNRKSYNNLKRWIICTWCLPKSIRIVWQPERIDENHTLHENDINCRGECLGKKYSPLINYIPGCP